MNQRQVKITGKRLLLKKPEKQKSDEGSMFIVADIVTNMGIIVAVGEHVEDKDLKVGVKVYHDKRTEEVQYENQKVLLVDEDSIFAIVEE